MEHVRIPLKPDVLYMIRSVEIQSVLRLRTLRKVHTRHRVQKLLPRTLPCSSNYISNELVGPEKHTKKFPCGKVSLQRNFLSPLDDIRYVERENDFILLCSLKYFTNRCLLVWLHNQRSGNAWKLSTYLCYWDNHFESPTHTNDQALLGHVCIEMLFIPGGGEHGVCVTHCLQHWNALRYYCRW